MFCSLLRKGMMPSGTIARGLLCLPLLAFIFLFDADSLSAQSVLVGNQNIELNIDSTATGLAEAFPATASANGQIGSINVFLDETSAATKIYAGIYADANGHPGSLLTQGSVTQFALGTWNTVTVTPVNVSSGTSYWIAILGTTGGKPVFRDKSTTACHSQTSSQSNLTALPSTWSAGQTWNTCNVSAYAVSGTFAATVMIGDQAVEANLDKNPAGRAEAFAATANATGSVGTIALYLDPTSGSGPVYAGLYADNNGHPGTVLGQGSKAQPVAGSWNQISISSSSITAGHKYWIAVLGTQSTSPYFRDRQTSSCHSETTSQTTLTTLPATWTTGATWATCYISAYGLLGAGSPVLSISSANLSFTATQGGANPAPANLTVSNTGTGTLGFTAASDASWLSVSPTSGTAPQTLQVSASIGSLTAGTYTGHVTVTATGAQGSPSVVTVTLTVAQAVPPAVLSVSPSTLSMSALQGGTNPAAASVNVTNTGGGALNFTAASDSVWLSVSPASGAAPQTLQISANIGSLTAGTYTGHVTVTAAGVQGSPSVVTVTLTVAQPPILSVLPSGLSLSATQGGTNPVAASVNVTNTGGGTLSFTAASDSAWLSVSPASGTAPQTLQISASIGSLTAGTYTGHVTVTAAGAQGSPSVVTVTLTVAQPPILSVLPSGLSMSALQGGTNPAAASVNVTNTGGGTLSFTTASDSVWLSVSPASGTAPQTLQVSASIGSLTAGTYTGHVTVTAAGAQGSPSVVTVTLTIAQPPVLSVLPSGLSMSATQGGTNPAAASVNVTNTGGGALSFTDASDSAWLSVSPASGTALQTLQISASIGSLTAGTYTGHVTVTAAGAQGSPSIVTVTLVVVLPGVAVGQVLSDTTGLPYKGATVQVEGGTNQVSSGDSGAYSISTINTHFFLSIGVAPNGNTGAPGTVMIEREIFAQPGIGTIPVDARVTPISPATSISPSGGSVSSGSLAVTIPPGSVSSTANFHLTTLSQQGLPGLLPLGWSPVAAFDLRSDTPTAATFSANFTQLAAALTMNLVTYDYTQHAWRMVTANLGVVNGSLTIPLPSTGSFALVTADAGNASLQVPSAGQPLTGVAVVMLPANTTSSGSLNPPSISPTGGTSTATLAVQSPTPLPSGTVIQANVTDTYSLVSGKQLFDPARTEDILLYQFGAPAGSAGAATFPVTPLQTFTLGQLASGDVHLDILSGRESVRGHVGGSDAASVTGGDATLTIAAGSLTQDTAISVAPEGVDSFLPSTATLLPLAEYNIDLSGQTLLSPAQLSVAAGSAKVGDIIFLVQVQRFAGAPYLVAVSLAQVTGSNLVTQAVPGFSGIIQGGDYIFYKLTSPSGYVSGTVNASTGPVPALVQTDGLPFVAFSSAAGSYVVPALAGPVNLTASILNTAVSGTAAVQVTTGQTATANISMIGQTESATVTPPNGTVGVPLTAEIDITAPDAFKQVSVTAASVTLTQNGQGANTPVSVRFVFSQGGTRLSVFPLSALQPSTTYTMAASGLANVLDGLVAVPSVTFTTQAITPPNFNTDALVFAMPDQNGNVQVSAPASSFPAGSTILIVDQTNGIVLSLTAFNDGSVSGQLPATIDDVLSVTITAPDKTTATFTRSQFVAPDGTTAVGSGGGTVTGPGGVELRIPQGALDKGVTFKIESFGPDLFVERPDLPNANFGSGLKITAPAMPVFKKEVKLAFPKPADAPDGSFYYVYRRLSGPNNTYTFETIDHAFVEGTGAQAKVVTGAPLTGLQDSISAFSIDSVGGFVVQALASQYEFLMWTIDRLLPGVASTGMITGRALRTVSPQPGQTDPTYVPIPPDSNQSGNRAYVWRSDDTQRKTIAPTAANGQFFLFDPTLGGGTRRITAQLGSETIQATASEVNAAQPDDQYYGIDPSLYLNYRNVGRVILTFPPLQPPPAPPQINIGIFTLDASNNRQPVSGIIPSGTNLTITFNSTLNVVSATINAAPFSTVVADTAPANPRSGFHYYRLNDPYAAGTPGVYTIVATAVDPLNAGNPPVTVSMSFLVVQQGGNNTSTNACPQVVGPSPANNAQSVSTSTFVQMSFTEPVTNITLGNVMLVGSRNGDTPSLRLFGFKVDGTAADPVQPTDAITSLTIQPLSGLEFGETYTLTLNANSPNNGTCPGQGLSSAGAFIVDLNKDASNNSNPIPLPKFTLTFTTFGPQGLGGTGSQYQVTTRPTIIGNYAYAGELVNSSDSALGVFDITDPTYPLNLGTPVSFIGRPIDTAGLAQPPPEVSQLNVGSLVAVAAGQAALATNFSVPGNVFLYDVSVPAQPVRVGAVSVTQSVTQSGFALRLAMKDKFLYTSTFLQGLQKIDLQQAITDYQQALSDPIKLAALGQEGQGFAGDSIKNTIPLPLGQATATMWDLKADDFVTGTTNSNGVVATQVLLVATGQLPLVVADPMAGTPVLYPPAASGSLVNQPLQMTSADGTKNYLLCSGRAVAVGTLAQTDSQGNSTARHVAVAVGLGLTGPAASASCLASPPSPPPTLVPMLAVVDISQPYTSNSKSLGTPFNPQPIGFVPLVDQNGNPVGGTDVALNGNVALVSTGTNVLLVNLENPSQPTLAGQISGNFGGWLALTDTGFLVGTSSGSNTASVQTAALGTIAIIHYVTPQIGVDANSRTTAQAEVDYEFQGNTQNLSSGLLNVHQDGKVVGSIPLPNVSPGIHAVMIPAGTKLLPAPDSIEATLIRPDGSSTSSIVTTLGPLPKDVAPGASPSSPPPTPPTPSGNNSSAPPTTVGAVGLQASISPDHLTAGQGNAVISISGPGFDSLTSLFVRGLDGIWVQLTASSQASGSTVFTLPATLSSSAGFLEISLTGNDDDASLPLPVADPTLPALGTAPQLDPQAVSLASSDAQGNPAVTAFNATYASGMSLVLGQGQTPILKLPSNILFAGSLSATQPSRLANIAGASTFVAVLSVDGTQISSPLPLPFVTAQFPNETSQPLDVSFADNAAAAFTIGDIEVTGTSRNPGSTGFPSGPLTFLEMQGVGLANGQTVQFAAYRGGQKLTDNSTLTGVQDITPDPAAQSGGTPPSQDPVDQRPDLMSGLTQLPDSMKQLDVPNVEVIGYDAAGRLISTGAPSPLNVGPLNVPFGGRVVIGAYQDKNQAVYILTPDEAKGQSGLQLVTNATVLIAQDPADSNTAPLAQVEKESGDSPGFLHVRGLSLNRNPAPQVTIRPTGTIQATGKNAAARPLFVYFLELGNTYTDHDKLIAQYANSHNIPPQYLKAQAIRESSHFKSNFRYEPSTIDFNQLTGDTQQDSRGNEFQKILTAPFCFYALPGTYLTPSFDSEKIHNQFATADSTDSNHTQFQLYDPNDRTVHLADIKRLNGIVHISDTPSFDQRWKQSVADRKQAFMNLSVDQKKEYLTERFPAVDATVSAPNVADIPLNLVRSGPLWRKLGTAKIGYLDGAWQDEPADPLHYSLPPAPPPPNSPPPPSVPPLIANGFTVDYDSGIVTLARPLAPGQTLTVRFWASDMTTNSINTTAPRPNQNPPDPALSECDGLQNQPTGPGYVGFWLSQAPNLNHASNLQSHGLHPDQDLKFPAPVNGKFASLYDFHSANIAPSQYPDGRHLSATESDRQLEFKTPALGQPPTALLDPKYKFATAQPYASSSYGILQLTAGAWNQGVVGKKLQDLFNLKDPNSPNFRSIFDLIDFFQGDQTNFDLAGGFHEAEVTLVKKASPQLFCGNSCNGGAWAKQWAAVTTNYNQGEDFYYIIKTGPSAQNNALVHFGDACFQPGTDPGQSSSSTQAFVYPRPTQKDPNNTVAVGSICVPEQKSRP
jgi:hypothetical protein